VTPEIRLARAHAEARALRSIGLKHRRYKRLPRQIPPQGIEREYGAALREAFAQVIRRAFSPLLVELPRLMESARRERGDRMDADEGKRVRELVEQASAGMRHELSVEAVDALAKKFARQTATYQRIQLGRQVKAALGADVFIADRGLRSLVEIFAAENVALIRGVVAEVAPRIERTTLAAIQRGTLHGDLAKELQKEFDYPARRATLIARDQVGKLYGQINASRQRELGAERFVWRTVHDERVRAEHEDRDGETYRYDDPPDGELPGEPILCRCYAEPIFFSEQEE